MRFKDYRPLGKGWYPFEILLITEGRTVGRFHIQDIQVNQPIDQSLFLGQRNPQAAPPEKPEKQGNPPENERLRKIIRTFEKKYR